MNSHLFSLKIAVQEKCMGVCKIHESSLFSSCLLFLHVATSAHARIFEDFILSFSTIPEENKAQF